MVGLTTIDAVVSPVFHSKEPTPVAVKVTDSPLQIVWSSPAETIGLGLMVKETGVLPETHETKFNKYDSA